MKKIIITFIATTFLYSLIAFWILPLNLYASNWKIGAYSVNTGLIWCSTTKGCLHEIGHAMDYRLGHISQTPDFINAVNEDLKVDSIYSTKIRWYFDWLKSVGLLTKVNKYSELYAEMYTWSSGYKDNMPIDFQRFYQWDNYTSWQVRP